MFEVVFSQLAVIFLMGGAGFAARRAGIIDARVQKGLSDVVMYIALPCAILNCSGMDLSQGARDILCVCLFALGFFLLILPATRLLFRYSGLPDARQRVAVNLVSFANVGFLGYPVVSIFLGSRGIFLAVFFNAIYNLCFFTYGIGLLSGERVRSIKDVLTKDFSLPATLVMLVILFFNIPLPSFYTQFMSLFGGMCTPLCMLIVGSMLATMRFGDVFKSRTLYFTSFLKLVLIPALVLASVHALGFSRDAAVTVFIMCAMPSAVVTAIFSERYGTDVGFASAGVVHSTFFFTVTIVLAAVAIGFLYPAV